MRTVLTLSAVLALSATSGFAAAQIGPGGKQPAFRVTRYHDVKGRFTKCPTAIATSAYATHATCKDDTKWTGKSHQGACSRHGGVKGCG